MTSLFKPGSESVLDILQGPAGGGSHAGPDFDLSVFLDENDSGDAHPAAAADETDQSIERPRRTTTASTAFAEVAARTFESCAFESRKVCLRQVMKCIYSVQIAKDPRQTVQSIHTEHGTYVLNIVQVIGPCSLFSSNGSVLRTPIGCS
jgi:hypothetical protein